MFTLSKTVLNALSERALEEKKKGRLKSLHGAESKLVEEALRQFLGLKWGEENGEEEGTQGL